MREKKDINIEIGGNIQVAREQAGYTQDTLSEMLGMTPNHLSAIERGASGISLEALQRLCRLLGVSADRIIFGTDEPEAEALALARRISDIKPEYRQQVQEPLSAILNGYEPNALFREKDFCVVANLQVVSTKTTEILYHKGLHSSGFHFFQQGGKTGTIKVRAGIAVIIEVPDISQPMLSGIFFKIFLLVLDGVRFSSLFIISG